MKNSNRQLIEGGHISGSADQKFELTDPAIPTSILVSLEWIEVMNEDE
jgi:hypothetical protein